MQFIKSIIIGIIQGITEWLPVSSTAHMLIFDKFCSLSVDGDFFEMYLVVIQLFSALAVAILYRKKLLPFGKFRSKTEQKQYFTLWSKIFVACLPLVIFGIFIDNFLEKYLYGADGSLTFSGLITVCGALIFYGILFIVVEKRRNGNKKIQLIGDFSEISLHDKKTAQTSRRTAQNGARTAQNGARTAQKDERTAQNGARTAQKDARKAQNGARTAQNGARTAQNGARTAQKDVRTAQNGAQTAQNGVRTAQNGVRTAQKSKKRSQKDRKIIKSVDEIGYFDAFTIGCVQMLSCIPGTSRSGSTILGAELLNIGRVAAAEFSFFLALPVMIGAGALKIAKFALISSVKLDLYHILILLSGGISAFLVSLLVIKGLLSFVKKHSFAFFGVYRIILAVAVLIYVMMN